MKKINIVVSEGVIMMFLFCLSEFDAFVLLGLDTFFYCECWFRIIFLCFFIDKYSPLF